MPLSKYLSLVVFKTGLTLESPWEALKNISMLRPTSKDYDLIGLGWGLGIGIILKLPGDSNMQLGLRTIALNAYGFMTGDL